MVFQVDTGNLFSAFQDSSGMLWQADFNFLGKYFTACMIPDSKCCIACQDRQSNMPSSSCCILSIHGVTMLWRVNVQGGLYCEQHSYSP